MQYGVNWLIHEEVFHCSYQELGLIARAQRTQ